MPECVSQCQLSASERPLCYRGTWKVLAHRRKLDLDVIILQLLCCQIAEGTQWRGGGRGGAAAFAQTPSEHRKPPQNGGANGRRLEKHDEARPWTVRDLTAFVYGHGSPAGG
ncbi:hypothetical protein GN956_G7789 [Arapaima gigas]